MPEVVLAPMPERLRAAAADVRDATEALKLATKLRDQLVREAVDEGMSQRAVADVIGQRVGNVSRILAKPDDDE